MRRLVLLFCGLIPVTTAAQPQADDLLAGAAKVEITNLQAIPASEPLFVKALVLQRGKTQAVLITLDAVAVGEIGPIKNDYLGNVRERLQKELNISPGSLIVNASHCHGIVCRDVDAKTVEAVTLAKKRLVPVTVGAASGKETRVSENRRLKLKNGHETDVRHAYPLVHDAAMESVGPIDPQIGVVRLDRLDGKTLAVVYNFACHPIMGTPKTGGNTADLVGYASKVIESNLNDDTVALFIQGCGGDINPIRYKDVHQPRHAEPLGNMLGLSVLQTVRTIKCDAKAPLAIINQTLELPRANHAERIERLQAEQTKLLKSLKGTTLNFKTFNELLVKYQLAPLYPSSDGHLYLTEKALNRDDLNRLDEANRANVQAYMDNILVMEELIRIQTNIALLQKHQATNLAAARKPLVVEVVGFRFGEFRLVTFPGELTVEIGLNIKKTAPKPLTFVAGYTNGYIYYTPTAKQLQNKGYAQEDCDTLVAPEWEAIFYKRIAELLKQL